MNACWSPAVTRRRFIQQPDGSLCEVTRDYRAPQRRGHDPGIMPDIEPFVSPVDGSVISSRSQLRVHNRVHDVTNAADFSPEYRARKKQERLDRLHGNTPQQNRDRERAVAAAIDKHSR